jgi:hypothetical protein
MFEAHGYHTRSRNLMLIYSAISPLSWSDFHQIFSLNIHYYSTLSGYDASSRIVHDGLVSADGNRYGAEALLAPPPHNKEKRPLRRFGSIRSSVPFSGLAGAAVQLPFGKRRARAELHVVREKLSIRKLLQ